MADRVKMDIQNKLLEAFTDLQAGRLPQANDACNAILAQLPGQSIALHMLAIIANQQKDFTRAIGYADASLVANSQNPECWLDKAEAHAALGENDNALAACEHALAFNPDNSRAHYLMSDIFMPGEVYLDVLARFHEWVRPQTYLEVGVRTGNSLVLANPPTIAVGIDPVPSLKSDARTTTKLFPMYSDDYFKQRNPLSDLEGDSIQMAFIDGLHVYEQALRDFINIEKYATKNTIVFIHDILPINRLTAAREAKTSFWSGDVWKVLATLIKHRPDLDAFTIAAKPTGLGVVTGLDPKSTVLTDNYDAIVREFVNQEVPESIAERRNLLNAIDNQWGKIQARVMQGKH